MMNLLAELKRRQMFRVAAAYAVVAWVLLQVVNNITPALRLPEWVATAVVVLLIVGFPIALLFCWIQQLAPGGESAKTTTGRLDWALIGALIVVIGIFAYEQFASNKASPAQAQQAGVAAARSASLSPAGVSVAVLPFANVSADPEQEFFSDGITDEISGALAKIPDLRVVGRTSAFQYKTRNTDLRSIGQALNATHLIEGSVRKAGDRVRIAVQLILADSGLQLWSENYDRELVDVFAIQEDIARAIASSLNMQLGLRPGENLVNNRVKDSASYEDYLRAKGLVRTRNAERIGDAITILERVVARDPEYAPAFGLLGYAYGQLPFNLRARQNGMFEQARPIVETASSKAREAAERAIQLDPQNIDGYVALGQWNNQTGKRLAAGELYAKALALDPNYPETLNGIRVLLAQVGHAKEALPISEKLIALEPFVPAFQGVHNRILFANGRLEDAMATIRNPGALAEYSAAQGRFGEAADLLQSFLKLPEISAEPLISNRVEAAVRVLRTAPNPAPSPEALPQLANLHFPYVYVGAPERVLDYYEGSLKIGFVGGAEVITLWTPPYAPVRKIDRFKAYVHGAGMVDYWKARGWPDLCKPVGADDFACE